MTTSGRYLSNLRAEIVDHLLQRADKLLALDDAPLELKREREAPVLRLMPEHVAPRTAARPPRLLRDAPRLVARGRAFALHALEHRHHFFRRRLPDDLQQQRLRVDVGVPTSLAHLFGHRRERQRLRDRRAALAEPLRPLLV